jgi:outer membrane protein OmpA-like peptidoglycan-associated protein
MDSDAGMVEERLLSNMNLSKKRSSKYVAGIYAFFIILFAFTLSLFYASRCQKPYPPANQDADILEPQESSDNFPKITKKIDADKGQSDDKYEASKSENEIEDESISAPLSKKKSSDDQKLNIDDFKTPAGETTNPTVKPIRSQPPLKHSRQKVVIYFSAESTGLTDEALKQLKTIFLFLLKEPDEELVIEGYGESGKTDQHNKNLSKMRANIVKGYFVKRGISESRIKAYWMGTENPTGVSIDQEGKNKTHQVEVKYKSRGEAGLSD